MTESDKSAQREHATPASESCRQQETVRDLKDSSNKYKELATGILLQYADSEMAGGSGYAKASPLAPSLAERVKLSLITYEKFCLAEKTYNLVAQTGINVDKYIVSHCWEARLERNVSLGFRRTSSDKRLNALMYPLECWSDLAVFTYLMASMACLQLADFSKSSFEPWAQLAAAHIPIETSHSDFGLACIELLVKEPLECDKLSLSLQYWQPRVFACFGPKDSERNAEYLAYGLKTRRNDSLAQEWQSTINATLTRLGIAPVN